MANSFDMRAPFVVEACSLGTLPSRLSLTANRIAEHLVDNAQTAACLVCGIDKPQARMRLLGAAGVEQSYTGCLCTEQTDGGLEEALRGQVIRNDDLTSLPESHRCAALREARVSSRLLLPVVSEGTTIGVVQLYWAEPHRYAAEEIERLQQLSVWWAYALENARLSDRTASFFDLANTLSTTMELKAVGNYIAEHVAKAMGVKGCSLRSLDRATRSLDLIGSYGLSRAYLANKGPVTAGENLAEVLEGKPVIIHDVATDARVQYPEAAAAEGVHSMVTVPMVVKGVVTGVLRVHAGETHDFDQEEMAFLTAAAGVAGAAIENAKLFSGIREDFDVLIDEIAYMRQSARAVCRNKES